MSAARGLLQSTPDRHQHLARLAGRLAEIPGIVGIRDSSGELELTAEYIRVVPPGFSALVGLDTLIHAGLTCGARGSIAATASLAPALAASIYDRFQEGDRDGALQAPRSLAPVRLAFTWGTYPVVIKEALNLRGSTSARAGHLLDLWRRSRGRG